MSETEAAGAPSGGTASDEGGTTLWEVVKVWAPYIVAILVIRTFVFEPFSIPSQSMVPTLLIGDHVIVSKFSYGLWLRNPLGEGAVELLDTGDPKRGDVIVFTYPVDRSTNYIKRVVGVPGDTIEVRNNQIVLNGEVQPRDRAGDYTFFADGGCRVATSKLWTEELDGHTHHKLTNYGLSSRLANHGPTVVPPGSVFVMGDNRDESGDSRQWKFVSEDLVKGRAEFIWLSFHYCDDGRPGWLPQVRSNRLFRGLYGTAIDPDPEGGGEPS